MTNIKQALEYASWGWHVLPVVKNGKNPATLHGVNDATTEPITINRWWTATPDFNIGIAAGRKSGIIVFDIDPRNGGDQSFEVWLEQHGGEFPETQHQLTAGGGHHFIFKYDERLKSCKVAEGIDLLCDGRYFLASPSKIGDRCYEWELSSDPETGIEPKPMPECWIETILSGGKKREKQILDSDIIEGNRNNGLTSLGGSLRNLGMREAEILSALMVVNERCSPPLPASEVRQIVQSVSSYPLENDVAANAALGSEAAEMLLGTHEEKRKASYFFTRASDLLSQPSPLKWVIKKWIPEKSISMIYGDSGHGKSFVTIDMACHIATGRDWQGFRTKSGLVVYCAGEGHYGISQRVAAWAQEYSKEGIENLLISNTLTDLDSLSGACGVIDAVRELTREPIELLIIDTLNNHMQGDENTAKDTRTMIHRCGVIGAALGCSILYNHHMGHSGAARARGSSAWKASLDAAMQVVKTDSTIEISCVKMKDSDLTEPIYLEMKSIEIRGWRDEDGETVKSCVLVAGEAPAKEKKPSKVAAAMKVFEEIWIECGEIIDGRPYLSRSAFIEVFQNRFSKSKSRQSAKNASDSGDQTKTMGILVAGGIVQQDETKSGWHVLDTVFASTLSMISERTKCT